MNTFNFTSLIKVITKRDLVIETQDTSLEYGKTYLLYRTLPNNKGRTKFFWTTPKSDEKFLRSFITAFITKYKEPNPINYDGMYHGIYYPRQDWKVMTNDQKSMCYFHHSSNMYSKNTLLKQIEENFNSTEIVSDLCRYGFYPTEYGVGIFALWATPSVLNVVEKMSAFLKENNYAYKTEFSDAKWVLRFKLGLDKNFHSTILQKFIDNQEK